MDAKEFFDEVARKNYEECNLFPFSFRELWNAVVSMNSVAEYIALDRLRSRNSDPLQITGNEIDIESKNIRNQHHELQILKKRADELKHVRRHSNRTQPFVVSSSASDPADPNTWCCYDGSTLHSYRGDLDKAFEVLSKYRVGALQRG